MFKLLVTLGTFLLVALALFALRQQERENQAHCAKLYYEIENRKETLRGQRVEISRVTSPTVLVQGLREAGIDTGDALQMRDDRVGRARTPVRTPAVETDLIAPLRRNERN